MNKIRYIHPLLVSLFPVFFLYSFNINHFQKSALIIPVLLVLALSTTVFVSNLLIVRRLDIASILSTFLVLFSLSYGRFKYPLRNTQFSTGNFFDNPDKIIISIALVIFTFLVVLLYKYKARLSEVNRALSIFSLILFGISLFNTVSLEIKLHRSFRSVLGINTDKKVDSQQASTPDIYYFIFDRYGGNQTLSSYGYDNTDLTGFLEEKGFKVLGNSTSNYPKTFLSLPSSLNMEYLDSLTVSTNGGESTDESAVYPMLQDNKVVRYLRERGYSYVHVGSSWDPTRSNPLADTNFIMTNGRYPFADEFTNGFLDTTIAAPILKQMYPDITAVSVDSTHNEARSRIFYEFAIIDEVVKMTEKKFVFTHILIPHGPYVLGKNCEPLSEKVTDLRNETENYLDQVKCANLKIKETVSKILEKSDSPPIIILQADEGPYPITNNLPGNLSWATATDATLIEKFPILNAVYLPGVKENPFYDDETPVNTFRILFNTYFNAQLPLLPDKNYIFSDAEHLYHFTDVTDMLDSVKK